MKIFLIIISVIISNLAIGQSKPNIVPLIIGDNVPEITISFDNKNEIRFGTLKGKLVILDFWNIWCTSCIAAMPKLDSLQKQFDGKIQIILVTKNTKAEADQLFNRIGRKTSNIPMVYEDKLLNGLFPHGGEPYHAWIDEAGKVQFLTSGYNTNSKSISDFLNGKKVTLSRVGDNSNWSDSSSLLSNKIGGAKLGIRTASIVTENILEYYYAAIFRFTKDSLNNKLANIQAINQNILDLYNIAFHEALVPQKNPNYRAPKNRIIVEVKDKYFSEPPKEEYKIDDWLLKHAYCYEIKLGSETDENVFALMQQDMNRSFDFTGRIEKRKFNCLVLIRKNGLDKISSKSPNANPNVLNEKGKITLINAPVSEVINLLAYANDHLKTPVVDGTGINNMIDLTILGKLRDIPSIKKQLQFYNLDLVEKEMEINMLVIKDKKQPDQ
jgi:thiol-disulfide isomerase/thioredoxin